MAKRPAASPRKSAPKKKATNKRAPAKKVTKKKPAAKKATRKKVTKKKPAAKKATRKNVTKKRAPAKKAAKKKASRKRASRKKTAAKKPAKAEIESSSNVVSIHRYTELSISQISLDTGYTRETVSKRLADGNIQPSRKRRGFPVYKLKDVLPALYHQFEGEMDPDKLEPFKRRAYWQGESEKLNVAQKRGQLVPVFDVERAMMRLFKIMTRCLDTLPDLLERDVGLNNRQLVYTERVADKTRESMYLEVMEYEDQDADSSVQKRE